MLYRLFSVLSFFEVVGSLPLCDFSSFLLVWKRPWSKVNKCHVVPFIWISFNVLISLCPVPFILRYFPFMFLSCSFHLAFMSFHIPSPYQLYRSSKSDMFKPVWWGVSAQKLAFSSVVRCRFCYRVAFVLEVRAGCHLQGSRTCTCISSLSLYSYSTLIVLWAGNALVVIRGMPSWNERPGVTTDREIHWVLDLRAPTDVFLLRSGNSSLTLIY